MIKHTAALPHGVVAEFQWTAGRMAVSVTPIWGDPDKEFG